VFKELAEGQVPALLRAAKRYDIAVLVLNQVTSNPSCAEDTKPVGGDAVSRSAKYEIRFEIEETQTGMRWAVLEKAPKQLLIGNKARYLITSTGMTRTAVSAQERFSVL
jgi:RecA/RadA recombinase